MKNLLQSKTIIIGIISIAIGLLTFLQGEMLAGQAITIQGIIMVVLRLITNEGIIIGKKE